VVIGAASTTGFAFDATTGGRLWETPLDASGHAMPMTFMGRNGR
jgi:hypothetical protein